MSTEKVNNNNGNTVAATTTTWSKAEEAAESTLQQLKAKKNKSNLFLIKSYSFIERNNNSSNNNKNTTNNNNNISSDGKGNAKMSRVSAPLAELLLSPDMETLPDITSLVLAQATAESQAATAKKQKQKQAKVKSKSSKGKGKWKNEKQHTNNGNGQQQEPPELDEQEAQLLRRNVVHEYEELLEHVPATKIGSLPRPQSLPAKGLFEAAGGRIQLEPISLDPTPILAKRRSGNIKRESFLRQSLQSIRRSFGSNKQSAKLSIVSASAASPLPSPVSSNTSSTSSASSAVSFSASSCSSAAAISLLTKAQAHNHILDEFLPTPVVLLLKDDRNLALQADNSDALRLTKR